MNELLYVLAAVAVAVLIIARQVRPQRIGGGGRKWLVVPVVLVVLGAKQGGVIDPHHTALSAGLLAAELVVGLVMGAGWAWTSRVWAEPDGSVWSRGTKATAGVWVGGLVARLALMGLGALAGVHQSTGALLIALGVSFALRGALLLHRGGALSPAGGPSYRGRVADRV
ncbi:DUF1453 domain-containing protein [Streptomyces sp. NPDC047002]|uniref:DUF1453 domain-containing protein n=1 Tax=Streptomyces sp. NPDC047002 TaxID=3155475 RepID=UPI0034533672